MRVDQVTLLDNEVGALEEGGHSTAKEQRTQDAVKHQKTLEGLGTKEIAQLVLELITHGLKHEGEEYQHPQPIGTAKARAVEQGERGKECSAKGDQCGECELPLTTRRVDKQSSFLVCLSQCEYDGVGSLDKHQEDKQCS